MPKDRCTFADRMTAFISDPDARVLTGKRRMGTEALLDALADHMEKDASANIIRVTDSKWTADSIRSGTDSGKRNHVLFYVEIDPKRIGEILEEFPDVRIYGAKELCHQVPVCFKEPAEGGRTIMNGTGTCRTE